MNEEKNFYNRVCRLYLQSKFRMAFNCIMVSSEFAFCIVFDAYTLLGISNPYKNVLNAIPFFFFSQYLEKSFRITFMFCFSFVF